MKVTSSLPVFLTTALIRVSLTWLRVTSNADASSPSTGRANTCCVRDSRATEREIKRIMVKGDATETDQYLTMGCSLAAMSALKLKNFGFPKGRTL